MRRYRRPFPAEHGAGSPEGSSRGQWPASHYPRGHRRSRAGQAGERDVPQLASGWGRTWNFSIPGLTPGPPSMCQVTAAP